MARGSPALLLPILGARSSRASDQFLNGFVLNLTQLNQPSEHTAPHSLRTLPWVFFSWIKPSLPNPLVLALGGNRTNQIWAQLHRSHHCSSTSPNEEALLISSCSGLHLLAACLLCDGFTCFCELISLSKIAET